MKKLAGLPDDRQLAVRRAWEEGGVPRSVDKSVAGGWESISLGKELNGRAGWQGPTLEKLSEVLGTTLWLVGQDTVTERGLRVNVGGVTNVVMERRAMFGLLSTVFEEVERIQGVGALSQRGEDELVAVCAGLPLAVSDLRAPVDPMVGVTDASEEGGALVLQVPVSQPVVVDECHGSLPICHKVPILRVWHIYARRT